jgi:hypothetical protein
MKGVYSPQKRHFLSLLRRRGFSACGATVGIYDPFTAAEGDLKEQAIAAIGGSA